MKSHTIVHGALCVVTTSLSTTCVVAPLCRGRAPSPSPCHCRGMRPALSAPFQPHATTSVEERMRPSREKSQEGLERRSQERMQLGFFLGLKENFS
ncbi:putative intersectin-1-like [Sesbania bispinosa]|nr:putative intersectin-1-like [Sesbania bispinosa]